MSFSRLPEEAARKTLIETESPQVPFRREAPALISNDESQNPRLWTRGWAFALRARCERPGVMGDREPAVTSLLYDPINITTDKAYNVLLVLSRARRKIFLAGGHVGGARGLPRAKVVGC